MSANLNEGDGSEKENTTKYPGKEVPDLQEKKKAKGVTRVVQQRRRLKTEREELRDKKRGGIYCLPKKMSKSVMEVAICGMERKILL